LIVRKIKPEELKRTNELFAIAFEFETDNDKTAKQVYEEATTDPSTRDAYYWGERWAAFEDDDKTMMSFFIAKPFPVNFDHHHCKMTGIGGVASLPQYRRRGGVRGCFEVSLPDMYDSGYEFSYLYPFSTAYYRKFGYEMCCERLRYQIRLNVIRPFSVNGSCQLVEQGNFMLEEIKQIYQIWQKKYNLMVEYEDYEYDWVLKSNPPKDQHFTYVYVNKDGIPKGFMTFTKVVEPSGRNLRCSRLFYTDIEGFQGLMNLVHSLSSDHMFFFFELPMDQVITPLFPEWSMGAGSCEKLQCGMVRVINVQKVLQIAKYRGSGTLVIQIIDPYISQNNNTFFVRFENDDAVEVSITDAPAEISLGIGDFSRLIVGAYDTSAIEYMETVRINSNIENIAKVFYLKPNLITEYF